MDIHPDIIDGWEIAATEDGGFSVADRHGMVAGPFGRREEAMAAALRLPRNANSGRMPERRPGFAGDRRDGQTGDA